MGQENVDFSSNLVVVPVSTDASAVSKIKVQVKESALEVRDVKVFLAGGESFDVALKAYLGAGDETRAIDLPGGPKVIYLKGGAHLPPGGERRENPAGAGVRRGLAFGEDCLAAPAGHANAPS
jgi:hypothetical protein